MSFNEKYREKFENMSRIVWENPPSVTWEHRECTHKNRDIKYKIENVNISRVNKFP